MMKRCPSCNRELLAVLAECPYCGLILSKWKPRAAEPPKEKPLPPPLLETRHSLNTKPSLLRLASYLVALPLVMIPLWMNRRVMERMWARIGIQVQGYYTPNAFAKFIADGDAEAVKAFLQAGMSPNERTAGQPVYFSAFYRIRYEDGVGLLKMLLDAGADANARDDEGTPAIMIPLKESVDKSMALVFVQELINKGADVNVKDKAGWTPLLMAALKGLDVRPFLKAGADVQVKGPSGETAFDLALQHNNYLAAQSLKEAGLTMERKPWESRPPALAALSKFEEIKRMTPLELNLHIESHIEKLANYKEKNESFTVLTQLGPTAVPHLIKGFHHKKEDVRSGCLNALVVIGEPAREAAPLIIEALKDNKWGWRGFLVEALPKIGARDQTTVQALISLLNDPNTDSDLKYRVVATLGELGPIAKPAVPALEKVQGNPEMRSAVLHAMRKIDK